MLKMSTVRVNTKYQITILLSVREKLNIQKGDSLLMDVQDGMIILIPQPTLRADALAGLHNAVWKHVNTKEYLDGERSAWMNSDQ